MLPKTCVLILWIISTVNAASVPVINCSTLNSRILLFTKTIPYFHQSIPAAIAAIQKLGQENGFNVDTSNDSLSFTDLNLQKYSAVAFVSTTGDVLNVEQQNAFIRFIQSGK